MFPISNKATSTHPLSPTPTFTHTPSPLVSKQFLGREQPILPQTPSYCHTTSLCPPLHPSLHLPLFLSIGGQKPGAKARGRVQNVLPVCTNVCRTFKERQGDFMLFQNAGMMKLCEILTQTRNCAPAAGDIFARTELPV